MSEPVMREGDYFRWAYKEPSKHGINPRETYWCKSRIGLVKGGRLWDTYWPHGADSASWSLADARRLLRLEFVANLESLVPCLKAVHEDHRPEDIVDLTHRTGGQCYLRVGAQRSMEVQIATWEEKRRKAQWEADFYERCIAREQETP